MNAYIRHRLTHTHTHIHKHTYTHTDKNIKLHIVTDIKAGP